LLKPPGQRAIGGGIRSEANHDQGLLEQLHERVLSGESSAREALAAEVLPLLRRYLVRSWRRVPVEMALDAATDAVMEYLAEPRRFDTCRGVPLGAFLRLMAYRNLQDAFRRHHRRHSLLLEWRDALIQRRSHHNPDGYDAAKPRMLRDAFVQVCNPMEMRAVEVWMDGPRDTAAIAKALALAVPTTSLRRQLVKRFKDRILKRLKRHFGTSASE
jgi:hypothetical protein